MGVGESLFVMPGINVSVFGIDFGVLVKRKEGHLIGVNNLSTQISTLRVTRAFLTNLGVKRY